MISSKTAKMEQLACVTVSGIQFWYELVEIQNQFHIVVVTLVAKLLAHFLLYSYNNLIISVVNSSHALPINLQENTYTMSTTTDAIHCKLVMDIDASE